MNMTLNKVFITVLKNCLHIVIYILLGLLLAFFINSTVYAAELDESANPNVIETTEFEETEFENTEPTASPVADPPGVLLLQSRADGTNIALSGTVIMVHRTFDNSVITELITDIYGEAIIELPAGDYYLRKTAVPYGYILNTDRINFNVRAGEIRELTILSKPEPIVTPSPIPNPGRLVIVNKSEGTGENLSGSVFVLFDAMNDYFIAEVMTNQFGEVSYNLPVGDYYLRQVSVSQDYTLNTNRIGFNIRSDEVRTVTVTNKLQPIPTPPPAEQTGRLVVTKLSEGSKERLQGAVFGVFNTANDIKITEIMTDRYGEAAVSLNAGDYYLRELTAPNGFILSMDKIGVKIKAGQITEITVTNKPEPVASQPVSQSGKLLLFMQAEKTKEKLQGAVFALHEARYDMRIGTLTTDQYGEATFTLPAGDYYLRQIEAPDGYVLNTSRINVQIKNGEIKEITVTGIAESVTAEPSETQSGRLLLFMQADKTKEKLQGAVFLVHNTLTDIAVGTITTDQYGEAAITLPAGNYYLRQIETPNGYILNTNRINAQIKSGEIKEITVTGITEPITAAPLEAQPGRLILTVRAERTGEKLQGIVFEVHEALTDSIIGWLTTDQFGEISVELPAGDYSMRQLSTPAGFILNSDRIPVRIKGNAVTEITVTRAAVPTPTPSTTPTPSSASTTTQNPANSTTPPPVTETTTDKNQGKIEIVTRAAGSGNLLSGGVYAVYNVRDNRRVAELTTGTGGKTELAAEPGMYYIRELRPTFGYLLETERIFLEVSTGETVVMELTKVRDWNITDLPADSENSGIIVIPQTGQDFPVMKYMGGELLMIIAFVFGGLAVREFIRQKPSKEVLKC